jgi:hypothetical protein
MDVPLAEQDARVAVIQKAVPPGQVLFELLAPSVARVFQVRHRAQAKALMLRAAIGTQRGGPERLKEPTLADPFGDGPFEYRKTDGGFELKSKLVDDTGKPVTLTVGQAAAAQ